MSGAGAPSPDPLGGSWGEGGAEAGRSCRPPRCGSTIADPRGSGNRAAASGERREHLQDVPELPKREESLTDDLVSPPAHPRELVGVSEQAEHPVGALLRA